MFHNPLATPATLRSLPRATTASGMLLALLLSACGGGGGGGSDSVAVQPLSQFCADFKATALPHGAVMASTEMRSAQGALPDVCIVRGSIVSSPGSTIHWAVELPARSVWNDKTLTVGGGALDGFIPTDDPFYQNLVGPSAGPYVRISSDSGHQSRGFEWTRDDVTLRDHAFDANHFALEVGTAIATGFYGKGPVQRYHLGHSNGGRSGLISTQKYPQDYDGVIAMEPAIAQQAHQVNLGPTVIRHIFEQREN
ncbi:MULTISPECIES: tannase/feruloyl esterase family alpha/beta hydrolase [unclassified Acidovorax]|uniref:tannase/feruloyl esterase family alpha/beta hydrolase n=1 Tax=unclassified Acidovorax TaxID=2684926 RepID=UPI0028833679|nr:MULTISPECIES: tannase/feruloyl esterase family alpha/beta hydrolase [unclassified Acidovorax]